MIAGNGRNCRLLFSDEVGGDFRRSDVTRLKDRYMHALTKSIFSNPLFFSVCGDARERARLGSHSIRKYPATYARANGCTIDEIDTRGRWKRNSRRMVDRYVDVEQPMIDGKVAAALCPGGPVKYVLVEGSGISRDWLIANVVPGIASFFRDDDDTLMEVLALPILWACFDSDYVVKLPSWMVEKVRNAYNLIRQLPDNTNPVQKKRLVVYSMSGTITISELTTTTTNDNNNEHNNEHSNNNIQLANTVILQQVQQQLMQLSDQGTASALEVRQFKKEFNTKIKILNNNINRVLNQPARPVMVAPAVLPVPIAIEQEGEEVVVGRVGGHGPLPPPVSLSNSPPNLYDLWVEYTTGLGGNKAAREFTCHERGQVRFKYSRRKVFWDCVSQHVRAGYTAHTAIDRIRNCYGQKCSVTTILNLMIKDKKRGGHDNLQL